VVVAVVAVGMMQVTVDKVVDVIAVRYRFMTTSGAVNVIRIVATTLMRRRAAIGIGLTHLDLVLNDGPVIGDVMQVPVMQIIDVIDVPDARVLAVGSVLVVMIFVGLTHRCSLN